MDIEYFLNNLVLEFLIYILRILNFQDNDLILGNEKFQISGICNVPIEISMQEAKENREELQNINLKKKINKNDIYLSSSGKKPKLSIYNTYSITSIKGEEDQISPDYNKNANSEFGLSALQSLFLSSVLYLHQIIQLLNSYLLFACPLVF